MNARSIEPAPGLVLVGGRVVQDPVQPGIELLDVAELRQLPSAPDERVLDRILGEVGVAEDQASDRVQPIALAGRETFERLPVAVLRSFDEFQPHRPSSTARAGPVDRLRSNFISGIKRMPIEVETA